MCGFTKKERGVHHQWGVNLHLITWQSHVFFGIYIYIYIYKIKSYKCVALPKFSSWLGVLSQ